MTERGRWHTYGPGECPCDMYEISEGGGVYACQGNMPGARFQLVRKPTCPAVVEPPLPPIEPPLPPIESPIEPLIEGKIDPKIIIIAVIAFILLSRS